MNESRGDTSVRVAGEVRSWLGRRGISARQAALSLGWTTQYMYRRLSGELSFSVDDLEGLGEILGIPAAQFFDWPEDDREKDVFRRPVRGFRTRKDSDFVAGDVPLETVAA